MAPYTINENIYTHGSGLEPDGPFLVVFMLLSHGKQRSQTMFTLFTFHYKITFGLHLTKAGSTHAWSNSNLINGRNFTNSENIDGSRSQNPKT